MAKFLALTIVVVAAAACATAQQQCACAPQPTVIQLSCNGNKVPNYQPPMMPVITLPEDFHMPPHYGQAPPAGPWDAEEPPAPAPAPASAPAPPPGSAPAPPPASGPAPAEPWNYPPEAGIPPAYYAMPAGK